MRRRGAGQKFSRYFLSSVFLLSFLCCVSSPDVQETALPGQQPQTNDVSVTPRPQAGGISDEIRILVETGTPASLARALEIIRSRELGNTDFGRVMNAVIVTFMKNVYPDIRTTLPASDPPQTHAYTRILREAQRGVYQAPPAASQDYLEYVLPFTAYLNESRADKLLAAAGDLKKAMELNPSSVIAPYFLGIAYEKSGDLANANLEYARAYDLSRDMYPAALGIARIKAAEGNNQEAIRLINDLITQYPDNITIKRQLAVAYYNNRDWARAEPAIAEILQQSPRDGQFLLMRAHILVEQGQYLQAQAPLDLYASTDPNNRLYLFLRARVQAEGYKNRAAALNYLRSILRTNPDDEEAAVYAAKLLMESFLPEDQKEGRDILQRLLSRGNPSPLVMDLAVQDAIRREAWRDAQTYLAPLLQERKSNQDLLHAYTIQHGLGNNASALAYARELYERDPSNEDSAVAYVSALINTGRTSDASRIIESKLASLPGGTLKSRYFYLRSQLRTGEEAILNDLRSSLFEDPRNLDALIAMFDIYHRKKDERRAVYYLKQALAIAPDNPLLKRYQAEYASALGSSF